QSHRGAPVRYASERPQYPPGYLPDGGAILSDLKEQIPSTHSPVNDIVIGMDGRIWVSLRPDHGGTPWLVLDPDGEPEMRVTLPANTRLMVADDRCVWGLEVDELGVESIVRYCR